jgi:iron complex outermembrane recepter protein
MTNATRARSGSTAKHWFLGLTLCLAAIEVAAQESPAALDEVVVTAQRRSERLQDVPISVEVFSASKLENMGVDSTADLVMVTPGLEINQQGPYTQPRIRGIGTIAIGTSIENPVALYIDGVYISSQAGSTLPLKNIAQVEVDKGPQGTLFGRNATGGLIQVNTLDPQHEFAWSGSAAYGNYYTGSGDYYVTSGITDNIAANFSIYYSGQGRGWGTNEYTDHEVNKTDDLAVRNKWLFTPQEGTKIKVSADYEQSIGSVSIVPAPGTFPPGAPPYTGSPWSMNSIYDPYDVTRQGGLNVRVDQQFGFANLMSLTAGRVSKSRYVGDSLSLAPEDAFELDKSDQNNQVTQEFQLQSVNAGWIQWTTGVYMFWDKGINNPTDVVIAELPPPYTRIRYLTTAKTWSVAGYGQATAEIMPATHLTLGARYTNEQRKSDTQELFANTTGAAFLLGQDDARHTFNAPTWRVSLDHNFSPDLMVYISDNRGFKSGGFNGASIPQSFFQPETLNAYEIGIKTQSPDHRYTMDVAGFYYDYKNIQSVRYVGGGAVIYNGPGATLYGADVDFAVHFTDRLTASLGGSFLHSYYQNFPGERSVPLPGGGSEYLDTFPDGTPYNAQGNRVALAPDVTITADVSYSIPTPVGDFTLNGAYAYNGGWFAEPDNRLYAPHYDVVNAQLVFQPVGKPWRLRFWGKNLFNEAYLITLGSQANGDFAGYGAPRTYGMTIEKPL